MYVGSALACSVQNSAMAPPAAVVDAARAARDQLETQVSASFGAMNRAVNRPGSDFTDLGLQSQVGGYDPPAPYGSGNTAGLPAGVSPNNGGAGGDTAPQVPYLNQPWPVGLPAMVCQIPPSIGGAPASQVFAAPMSAAEYVAPPGTPAPAGIRPLVTPPTQPAAAPPPGQRAASAAMSRLNDLYKAANKAQDDYQAQVRAAIAKADPSGRGRVELVYPGQAPGAPRYAAGYGSPPGTQIGRAHV